MRIKNLDGATSLGHEGETYEADADGMFEVPHEVGEALVGFPHWVREHEWVDQTAAAQRAADKDPVTLAGRVAALESVLPTVQARIGELETQISELKSATATADNKGPANADGTEEQDQDSKDEAGPEDDETGDTEADEKPQRARKTAATSKRK